MRMKVFESESAEDTFSIGKRLGKDAKAGTVIALNGELGAGKTVFVKGFAKGLGIEENVTSPTFNIVKGYSGGRLPLYHFDVYRIGDVSEMDEIGYEDCFFGDGVSLVEWAQIIDEILPGNCVNVDIKRDLSKGCDYREIVIYDDTGD